MIDRIADSLALLSQVQGFYDSAWTKLLFVVVGGFAFGGVIFPFVLQRLQSKSFAKESKGRIEEAIARLEKQFDERIASEVVRIKRDGDLTLGAVNLVQAQINFANGDKSGAASAYAVAAFFFLTNEHYHYLPIAIEGVKKSLVDGVNKTNVSVTTEAVDRLILALSDKKQNGRYDSEVEQIKTLWNTAKEKP
jgi:hypothetical protein